MLTTASETMLHIRPAEARDLHVLTTILNEAIDEGDALIYDAPRSTAHVGAFVEQNLTVHVAELDGEVVGGYTLRPNHPGRGAHVCNATYIVARSARGRGIGRAMGEHSLDEARSLGFTALQLNAVVATNRPAIRLLRSLGFVTVGTLPDAFRCRDESLVDLLVMHRTL